MNCLRFLKHACVSLVFWASVTCYGQSFIPDESLIDHLTDILLTSKHFKDSEAGSYKNMNENAVRSLLIKQIQLQQQLLSTESFIAQVGEFRELEEYAIGSYVGGDKNLWLPKHLPANLLNSEPSSVVEEGATKTEASELEQKRLQLVEIIRQIEELESPDALLVGVVNSLPKDIRVQVFEAQTIEEKVELLRTLDVDNQAFDESFDYSRHSLGDKTPSLESVLLEIEERTAEGIKIVNSLLHVLNADFASQDEGQKEKLLVEFFNQNQSELLELFTQQEISVPEKKIKALISWLRRYHFTKAAKADATFEVEFTLAEAPPYSGIFRGCFGGDCSTVGVSNP
ncbi:MAG: hypothetical protein AAF202_08145 [Pseudomonadota bacterium]